ncbi:unnamed protein product [Cylicocyclus nassatus]|uniref:Uncharacterized protein n=1 Tax=Cylicocyclus nassatus TaxID=53992 RepID=A0AA36HB81_CYLNA|nr:unnamed protein product [Cylicocyclus nassatus]
MMLLSDKINRACWLHDRCYEKQKGKSYCDKVFCEKLDYLEAKYLPRINFCPIKSTCTAVTYFGDKAYEACQKD